MKLLFLTFKGILLKEELIPAKRNYFQIFDLNVLNVSECCSYIFPIDDLQCFRFCRKFDAWALRGRPDQNKHCRSRHSVSNK